MCEGSSGAMRSAVIGTRHIAPCDVVRASRRSEKNVAGFSLVELMVGLVIGLLTVLVVIKVLGVADARRRTTTSGADATINAQLAAYTIERDGKSAGYGMTTLKSALGCIMHISNSKVGGAPLQRVLAPARITDGAAGAPDRITLVSNLPGDIALPTRIVLDHPMNDTGFYVQSDIAAQPGSLMLAVPADSTLPGAWCTAFEITSVTPGANFVKHEETSDWNVPASASIMPAAGYKAGDYLVNLGRYVEQTYDIGSNGLRLTRQDLAGVQLPGPTGSSDLYAGIVQLQAVYGKDTDGNGVVDRWDAVAPAGNEWKDVIALHLALVARSQKLEPEAVTPDSSCASDPVPAAALCWRPDPARPAVSIDVLGTVGGDWQRYRYQVLETTIPLRNTIWEQ